MKRYFFNIVDGVRIEDEDGQPFPDIDAARSEAVRSAHSIMADEIWAGRLPLDESIEVADENGCVVFVVAFRDTIEISAKRPH